MPDYWETVNDLMGEWESYFENLKPSNSAETLDIFDRTSPFLDHMVDELKSNQGKTAEQFALAAAACILDQAPETADQLLAAGANVGLEELLDSSELQICQILSLRLRAILGSESFLPVQGNEILFGVLVGDRPVVPDGVLALKKTVNPMWNDEGQLSPRTLIDLIESFLSLYQASPQVQADAWNKAIWLIRYFESHGDAITFKVHLESRLTGESLHSSWLDLP